MSLSRRASNLISDEEKAFRKQIKRVQKAAQAAQKNLASSHPHVLHQSGDWRLFTETHMNQIAFFDAGIVLGAAGVDAWRRVETRNDHLSASLPAPCMSSRRFKEYFK